MPKPRAQPSALRACPPTAEPPGVRLLCGAPPSSPPTARTLSRGCVSTGPRQPQQDLSLSLSCPLSPHTRAWASKVQTPPHLGRRPAGAQVRRFLPSSLLTCPACSRIHQRPLSFLFLKEPKTRVTMVEETPPFTFTWGGGGQSLLLPEGWRIPEWSPRDSQEGLCVPHEFPGSPRGDVGRWPWTSWSGTQLQTRPRENSLSLRGARRSGLEDTQCPQAGGGSATQHWAPPSSAVTHRCQFSQPQEVPCAQAAAPPHVPSGRRPLVPPARDPL